MFGSLVEGVMGPTRVMPGAFAKTLVEDRDHVRILWQHNTDEPIGFPIEMREVPEGLYLRAHISDTARGRDALAILRDAEKYGQRFGLSIGFDPVEWELVKGPNDVEPVRHLKAVRLWETSLVSWGADPLALVHAVHGRPTDEPEPDAVEQLASLIATIREQHEGKVLSGKNRSLVADSLASIQSTGAALQALLDASEPKKKDDELARSTEATDEHRRISALVQWQLREADLALMGLHIGSRFSN